MKKSRLFQLAGWLTVFCGLALLQSSLGNTGAQTPPAAPRFEVDPFWPKMPEQWIFGQVAGIAVDGQDHIWIIQRPWSLNSDEKAGNPEAKCCREAPPVMEFDAAGN